MGAACSCVELGVGAPGAIAGPLPFAYGPSDGIRGYPRPPAASVRDEQPQQTANAAPNHQRCCMDCLPSGLDICSPEVDTNPSSTNGSSTTSASASSGAAPGAMCRRVVDFVYSAAARPSAAQRGAAHRRRQSTTTAVGTTFSRRLNKGLYVLPLQVSAMPVPLPGSGWGEQEKPAASFLSYLVSWAAHGAHS